MWLDEEKVINAFRTGDGIGWHEHHRLFFGTEAFFRWGVQGQSDHGLDPCAGRRGRKAEVRRQGGRRRLRPRRLHHRHGSAYPNAAFVGLDYHAGSINTARARAEEAGLDGRVKFEMATAKDYPGNDYDLICFMDCLHDMGDPLGAAKHARQALAEDGAVLLVEPFAGNNVEDNLNAVGRLYYAASTAICTANSLSQEVGLALGAQAGEARLREIMRDAGFSRFRRAAETPFNLVLEARP